MGGTLNDHRASVTSERWLIVDLEEDDIEISDPDAKVIYKEGTSFHLSFEPDQISPAELISRISGRYKIKDLFVENPPIENIISRMYKGYK